MTRRWIVCSLVNEVGRWRHCPGLILYVLNMTTGHSKSSWWRHQMETFSGSLAFCAENSPVTGEFPSQRPVTRSFDVFFHLCLNKRLSKQSWVRWFETPLHSLWRHCNDIKTPDKPYVKSRQWTNQDQLTHICVNKSGPLGFSYRLAICKPHHHWFRPATCSAPSQ